MRALLYRPHWQSLRVSLLKENRNDGGWTTMEGTEANLKTLLDYNVCPDLASFSQRLTEAEVMGYQEKHEIDARLYRTINCLNAVRMGNSGMGTKGSRQDALVLAARNFYQGRQTAMYHQYLTYAAVRWDWRVVERELLEIWDMGDYQGNFEHIETNLKARMKDKKSTARPELFTFMALMEKVRLGG
jgi:hypothetical protein